MLRKFSDFFEMVIWANYFWFSQTYQKNNSEKLLQILLANTVISEVREVLMSDRQTDKQTYICNSRGAFGDDGGECGETNRLKGL